MAATTPRKKKRKDPHAVLKAARRAEKVVPICLRLDLVVQWDDLAEQLDEANKAKTERLVGNPEAQRIARDMEAVREQMLDATVDFTLRALPNWEWEDLKRQHPPRDPKKELFNAESLGPAMIRACTVDPEWSEDEWQQMLGPGGALNKWQFTDLSNAAWTLNETAVAVPFSQLALVLIRGSGELSRPPSS